MQNLHLALIQQVRSVIGMELAILAASGRTGIVLVRQALQRGHTVTALVRDPGRIDLPGVAGLHVVVVDAEDPASIVAAVGTESVVLSGLGTDRAGVLLAGAKAVVAAGRRRIIWLDNVRSHAAGVLLVEEAGGIVTDLDGKPWDVASESYLAAAPGVHAAALEILTP